MHTAWVLEDRDHSELHPSFLHFYFAHTHIQKKKKKERKESKKEIHSHVRSLERMPADYSMLIIHSQPEEEIWQGDL